MVLPGYSCRQLKGPSGQWGRNSPGAQAVLVLISSWPGGLTGDSVMGRACRQPQRLSAPLYRSPCLSLRPSPSLTVHGLDLLPTKIGGFHVLMIIFIVLLIVKVICAP